MTIIQHAVWRYYLSYRDVQELLHQRGTQVSHKTLREWCIKFAPLFVEDLRHRDKVCTSVDGVRHWLWRAVNENGFVFDILQRYRGSEAAKTFLARLLGEYDVPEVIHTDQLLSYGAAIREIPSLADVDHHHSRTSVPAKTRRSNQKQAFQTWSTEGRGDLNLRSPLPSVDRDTS
nr:DDE-type integrase/transposase/recombinase [Deinococcus psychrotolerans]